MNSLTMSVIAFIIIFMIIGAVKGFVRSALGIILSIIAIVAAYMLVPITANLIINYTNIDETIHSKIRARIEAEIEEKIINEAESMGLGDMASDESVLNELKDDIINSEPNRNQQIDIINNLGISDTLKNSLIENNNTDIKNDMGVTGFYDYITKYITYRIVNLIAYILTFVFIGLIFAIITYTLKFAVKLPVINGLNKIGGAALGFVEAIIIIWILFAVIDNLPAYPVCVSITNQIKENGLLTFIYEKNVIIHMLESLKK